MLTPEPPHSPVTPMCTLLEHKEPSAVTGQASSMDYSHAER